MLVARHHRVVEALVRVTDVPDVADVTLVDRNRVESRGVRVAMFKQLTPTIVLATLVLGAAACADGSAVADPAPETSAPPTTAPPTTEPPSPSEPPPTSAPDEPGLPERYVEIDDGAFDSLDDMADTSDVIVVATVTGEDEITSDRDDLNPRPDELLGLRLSVDEVLKGSPGDEIRLTWLAFEVDDAGEPIASNLLNGIPVPRQGDQLVLFLRSATSEDQALLDYATHTPVMLDGVGFVEDGAVTMTDDVVPDAAVLTGATLADIRAAL